MISKIRDIASQLATVYPADEADALAWWIAEESTGLTRTQIITGCKGTTNFSNLQDIIARLLHFEPIQYVFGHTLWGGLDLKLTPATLIPRPETAELVEHIIGMSDFRDNGISRRVLDIGTGSGCIAIALKKRHPNWQITGIDISNKAIDVAKENARRNEVEVTFEQADIFSDENGAIGTFDIVVSNPPYICEREKATMRRNVLDYEPASALFVPDNDPLLFYRRIAQLHIGKYLFLEINEAHADELSAMLDSFGYTDTHIIYDSYGKPRIIESRMVG